MGLSFGKVVEGWVGVASKNSYMLLMVLTFFVLLMWVHGASFLDI
jgi:hypothetical protein